MSRKIHVLQWISDRRANSLMAAAEAHNHHTRDADWHEGYAQAMSDAKLQVMTIPEEKRKEVPPFDDHAA